MSESEGDASEIELFLSRSGEVAREVCLEKDNLAGDVIGNESGAEVSSSISAALSFRGSPLILVDDNCLVLRTLSSGMS
jgi:hypothetical protein